jgi:phage repressor protein C with HTH and peptisase S24 domain
MQGAFGDRVRERRVQLGLTLASVARQVGCQKGYLSMIETGRRPPPTEAILRRLEHVLRLQSNELAEAAHWQTAPSVVREQLRSLRVQTLRASDLAARLLANPRNLDQMLKSGELHQFVEAASGNMEIVGRLEQQVPIINRVAAGYPSDFTDLGYPARMADEYLQCPAIGDEDAFAARVVGNSMEPTYAEGDTVVFSPIAATPNGSDCFVRLKPDDETTFKRVFFEGDDGSQVRLRALNPAYKDRVVDREQVAGMYAALYVLRRIQSAPVAPAR